MALWCRERDGVSTDSTADLYDMSQPQSSTDSRPRQYGSGWLSHDWAVPKSIKASSVKGLAQYTLTRAFDSVWVVAKQLPPHLLLSLIYRVVVLHFATRIIPVIRKASLGYDNGEPVPSFWDGRSLGEEPTVSCFRRAVTDTSRRTCASLLSSSRTAAQSLLPCTPTFCVSAVTVDEDAHPTAAMLTRRPRRRVTVVVALG
jgi:hypothetical protein